jgi:hypothetical protein
MKCFTHPKKVCMTYFEHCKLSLYLAKCMFIGFIKALGHAFIPDIFITSSSDISSHITYIINKSGCKK